VVLFGLPLAADATDDAADEQRDGGDGEHPREGGARDARTRRNDEAVTVMSVATPMATIVDASLFGSARSTREKVRMTRPRPARPRTGTSIGNMIRSRSALLYAGSAVERSAQLCTIHSSSATPRMPKPA